MNSATITRLRALSLGCLALSLALYAAAPLATLWSVGNALRQNDVAALRAALDWRSVRAGLKADLGGGLPVSLASSVQTGDDLPGFGESFATTLVSHAVDDAITPERLGTLLAAATVPAPDRAGVPASASLLDRLGAITFLGPLRFEAAIRLSNDPAAEPVSVSMRLRHGRWLVTRVHLPEQLAGRNDRT